MKKILFLLITAFAVESCNDDCDHGFGLDRTNSDLLVGSWYEEITNEEDVYSAPNKFYGRFCNVFQQGEGQGTYIIDSERNTLKENAQVNGMPYLADWKLRDVSQYQFTQYNDWGILTYGKIVETHNMEGSATQQITFHDLSVQSYESLNEHIATVSRSGLITTTGEKGSAYIKVKCEEATVYVKVIVGSDYADLWIDYSGLLGGDYTQMKDMLGNPSKSTEISGYSYHTYVTPGHNILSGLNIGINTATQLVEEVDLVIKEGVTSTMLLAYMKEHYYPYKQDETEYHYTTSSTLNDSRACYILETDPTKTNVGSCTVLIVTAEEYERLFNLSLWPRCKEFLGLSKDQVKEKAERKGFKLSSSDMFSTAKNGCMRYTFDGYNYSNIVEFAFNVDNVVSEYSVYFDYNVSTEALMTKFSEVVATTLSSGYVYDEKETSKGSVIWYDKSKTLKVIQKQSSVTFMDISRQVAEWSLNMGEWWKGLGFSTSGIVRNFGDYSGRRNEQKALTYLCKDRFMEYVNFLYDDEGIVKTINLFLNYDTDAGAVRSYLNSLYTFSERNESDNGAVERWLNNTKAEDATMRVSFYPDYNVIAYGYPPKIFSISEYVLLGQMTSEIKDKITSMGGSYTVYGSQVCYDNPMGTGITNIMFSFSPSTYKCNKIIINLDMNSISEQEIADSLKSQYELSFGFEGVGYMLNSKDGTFQIFYDVSNKEISIY